MKISTGVGVTGLAFVIVGSAACGPGRAPRAQEPLVTLTAQTGLDPVRLPFNAAAKQETRVILLLSPT